MTKSLMISIQPQHAVNILNGKKTLELRTWIPKGYVGWVNVYISFKGQYALHSRLVKTANNNYRFHINDYLNDGVQYLNGKVVFRFWFDDYIAFKYYEDYNYYFAKRPEDFGYTTDELLKRLCLSRDEFKAYGKGKDLYAWHIKKLEIFDEPKSLSDFKVLYGGEESLYPLKKAPQRSVWIYVEDKEIEK